MHERSLVRSLLHQVAEVAKKNGGGRVSEIRMSIGVIAGVEPQLIREAFDELKTETVCLDADLLLETIQMTVHCDDCGQESQLDHFVFRCHHCQSGKVRLIRGEEFHLLTVTLLEESHV